MTGLLSVAGSTPSEGFELKSTRFDTDAFLQRTPSTTSNRRTYTTSVWVKRGKLEHDSEHQVIFSTAEAGGESAGDRLNYLSFQGTGSNVDKLRSGNDDGSMNLITDAVYRDPSAWYHIVYACLLYTSPSPRDKRQSRMPSSA